MTNRVEQLPSDVAVALGKLAPGLRISRVGRNERFPDPQGVLIAFQRALGVAEVRRVRPAEDAPHPVVGCREFALQCRIAAGFRGQAVEVRKPVPHQPLPHRRGPRQRLDRVVVVEEHRVGQLPHVVEAPLGARARGLGNSRLPARGDDTADEREQDCGRRGDTELAPPHESGRSIRPRVTACDHWQPLRVPAHVVREERNRAVPLRRFLPHRRDHDGVEIAAEPSAQTMIGPAGGHRTRFHDVRPPPRYAWLRQRDLSVTSYGRAPASSS